MQTLEKSLQIFLKKLNLDGVDFYEILQDTRKMLEKLSQSLGQSFPSLTDKEDDDKSQS